MQEEKEEITTAEATPRRRRIMLILAYDGTNYCGFAAQKDEAVPTIEGAVNRALKELTGEEIEVTGASRTDSGVHALCNYCVFDTLSKIPADRFANALNAKLPEDIVVRKSREVDPSFSPRGARTEKTYVYRIYCGKFPQPLLARYAAHTWFHLDIARMQEAAGYLVGEHDFKSFCNVATGTKTTVRTITKILVEEEREPLPRIMLSRKHTIAAEDEAKLVSITVTGRGFLYNMVRIIAGTLIEVGRGNREPSDVQRMLEARDRQAAGPTAPACGLILTDYRILGMKAQEKKDVSEDRGASSAENSAE